MSKLTELGCLLMFPIRIDFQVLGWTLAQGPLDEAQPAQGDVDGPLPEEAQEGHRGGDGQEAHQEDPEVPTCGCGCHTG